MTEIEINIADVSPYLAQRADVRDGAVPDVVVFEGTVFAAGIYSATRGFPGFTDDEKERFQEIAATSTVPVEDVGLLTATAHTYAVTYADMIVKHLNAADEPVSPAAAMYDSWLMVSHWVRETLCAADATHVLCETNQELHTDVMERLKDARHTTLLK